MYKKISKELTLILVVSAFLISLFSVVQSTLAQPNQDMQEVLTIHNKERAEVKVPPLTWSDSLAAEAQTYADQLRSQGYFCRPGGPEDCPLLPHGATNENLAWGSVGYPIAGLVQTWADEKPTYDMAPIRSERPCRSLHSDGLADHNPGRLRDCYWC